MHINIPVWFYGFDSVMYFISSLIGFLLSFYFNKIYSISSEKRHMYLYLGFLLISIGLLSLSITNMFSYFIFRNCHVSCSLGLMDNAFSLEDFSFFLYFGLSITAYLLFVMTYKPENLKFSNKFILIFLGYLILITTFLPIKEGPKLWYSYHEYFHLTAFIMMVFVFFKNLMNYIDKGTSNSFLVTVSFGLITLFHFLHIFSFISGWMYVFAHISMLIGFSSLLVMALRVKK